MPMIKIEGKDYDTQSMSTAAKQQLQCVQFVDAELARLDAKIAVLKTARLAYIRALSQALQPAADPVAPHLAGDTIKLG